MAAERILSEPLVVGAVLAGGASRRFNGGDKSEVIGPSVLAALRAGGVDPIVAVGGTPGVLPVPTIADRYPGEGPLGAVATAATFARSGWVLVATCDLPLLDGPSVRAIVEAIDPARPTHAVVASIDGAPHISLGAWPAGWARPIHAAMRAGERRFRHLLTMGEVEHVELAPEVLRDADDTATLDQLLSSRTDIPGPGTAGA